MKHTFPSFTPSPHLSPGRADAQAFFRSWWRWVEMAFLVLCGAYHVSLVYRFFQTEFIIELLRATRYHAHVDVTPVAFWDEVRERVSE